MYLRYKALHHTDDVIGFMVAKGFLIAPQFKPRPNAKLNIKDVLWVAEHVEPRVLEVFAAAYLHFPRAFVGTHALPEELQDIIELIRRGADRGPDYCGIAYHAMRRWAERQPKDRRAKPVGQIKRNKTFRLLPEAIDKLRLLAQAQNVNETEMLEQLILSS